MHACLSVAFLSLGLQHHLCSRLTRPRHTTSSPQSQIGRCCRARVGVKRNTQPSQAFWKPCQSISCESSHRLLEVGGEGGLLLSSYLIYSPSPLLHTHFLLPPASPGNSSMVIGLLVQPIDRGLSTDEQTRHLKNSSHALSGSCILYPMG